MRDVVILKACPMKLDCARRAMLCPEAAKALSSSRSTMSSIVDRVWIDPDRIGNVESTGFDRQLR
jgi:hypothetical protein